MSSSTIINGPAGQLEARYHAGENADAPIALFLHPHPLHGGTMNNKVIYSLYYTFQKRGFSVLRFNFRGVGLSDGIFAKGEGELADAAAALDWLQIRNPNARHCWIIGFSFGAWVSLQLLMRRPDIVGFIAVAPPSNMYDFGFLSPCPASGLVIQGEKDVIVPMDEQAKLMARLGSQRHAKVSYEVIAGADHYFVNHIKEIQSVSADYLDERLKTLQQGDSVHLPFFGLEDLEHIDDHLFDDDSDLDEDDSDLEDDEMDNY